MKAISLWQPWASLWFTSKIHETRDWAWKHRGWTAVHATKKIVHDLDPRLADIVNSDFGGHWGIDLPRGAIIGVVNILDVVPAESVFAMHARDSDGFLADDFYCGNFAPGRFAFRRGECRLLREPVPYRGHQGPFEIPDDLVREAMAA
jgi:hypothetical protein